MKRKILSCFILFTLLPWILASAEIYSSVGFEYAYSTNIFSSPLPTYDNSDGYKWLNWRRENPFIKKHSIGFNVSMDIYFLEDARTGISAAMAARFPLKAESYTPIPDDETLGFDGSWEYHHSDCTSDQSPAFFGAIGPIFRARFNFIDLGVATRISLGSFKLDGQEIILGIQAEPFVNILLSDRIYLNTKFTFDSHLMRFISNKEKIFDLDYQMITLAPSIGIGIRF